MRFALGLAWSSLGLLAGLATAACGGTDDDPVFGSGTTTTASTDTVGVGGGGGAGGGGGGVGGVGGAACADETCDGLDNDCDGEVDEGCPCNPGVTQSCYSGPAGTLGVGACKAGTQSCGADGTFGPCEGEVLPVPEQCNFVDDDCDGAFDEGLGKQSCGIGECLVTVESCENGQPKVCVPLGPSPELCDGLDNDCNGAVDDGNPGGGGACLTGNPGVCAAGTLTCVNGAQVCVQNVGPSSEKCDGLDNDCDGASDEGNPGGGAACSTGLAGACGAGVLTCGGGVFTCSQTVQPSPEACDGIDNDCNGATDEGNPGGGAPCNTGLPGVCAAGVVTCTGGILFCSQITAATTELCNGFDDDCDGTTDEPPLGGWGACSTGLLGPCAAGTLVCSGASLVCQQDVASGPELCDGVDNDCDGSVDDGDPGGGAGCATGLPGACSAGTQHCAGGQIQCAQNVQPTPEVCNNGIDDDCDGQIDPPVITIFAEDFSDNLAGWTLDPEWQIGPATASSGQSVGNPDPALDHSASADNGVAGVVIGGNASTALHPTRWLTSPVVDTSGSASPLFLRFWRWLNSDYTPYMQNVVQVYDGSSWVSVWQSGPSPPVQDAAWTAVAYDISAYKNPAMQIRIGFDVGSSGVWTVSSWNVDDLAVQSGLCF